MALVESSEWQDALVALNKLFKEDPEFRESILSAMGINPEAMGSVENNLAVGVSASGLSESSLKGNGLRSGVNSEKINELGTEAVGETVIEQIKGIKIVIDSTCDDYIEKLSEYEEVLKGSSKTFGELQKDGPDPNVPEEAALLTIADKFLEYDDPALTADLQDQSLDEVRKLLKEQIETLGRAAGQQLDEMIYGYDPAKDIGPMVDAINALGQEFGVLDAMSKDGNALNDLSGTAKEQEEAHEQQKDGKTLNKEVAPEQDDKAQTPQTSQNIISDINSMTEIKAPETPAVSRDTGASRERG